MNAPHKTEHQPSATAVQKCISPECAAEFALRERIYVCRSCGEPLEIDCSLEKAADLESLKARWASRATSRDPRDRSGVWRYREVLPFADRAPIVTLFEGNTPIYDAPKCAQYAGLTALTLKHQGANPPARLRTRE